MTKRTQNRLDKDAPVAIIGCGIAGLSTAISLAQAGFTNVHIFERDADQLTRREGFGLTLTYNPQGPLASLGILEEVAQQDCPSRAHYVFSPSGAVLGYYGNAFSTGRGFGQRGNIRIPRQKLQKIMTDRLATVIQQQQEHPEVVQSRIYWGHTLTNICERNDDDEEEGKIQLQFTQSTLNTKAEADANNNSDADSTTAETIQQQNNTVATMDFDLVIAADGVHSSVVKALAPKCQPRPLKVMIILGIADNFQHPLLTERGFYVVDGKHRLFTMPYQGDKYASRRRIMWQLSYRYYDGGEDNNDDDAAVTLEQQYKNPAVLRDLVLGKCSQWHEPVCSMIRATPLETIWGTPLMDRSPKLVQEAFQSTSRIVCIGDALHAMSPFKGQGANNALLDGPLIAECLQRAKIDAAVRAIWRESVQRTNKIVQASREAAEFWHSPECIPVPGRQHHQQGSPCHFAGVDDVTADQLLMALAQRKITADLSGELDESIRCVIRELGVGLSPAAATTNTSEGQDDDDSLALVINFASLGSTSELRKLSLEHASSMRIARDANGRAALHVAAQAGHFQTCRWLLKEALVDPWALDSFGRSALDDTASAEIVSLIKKVMHTDRKSVV